MELILLWLLPGLFFIFALIGTYRACFRSGGAVSAGQGWLAVFFYGAVAWAVAAIGLIAYRLWS